jgi:hypothetical protein
MYVYTGAQMSERTDIMNKLQDDLPGLRFAEDPRQADIVLVYGSAKSNVFAGNWGEAIGSGTTTCNSMGNTTNCSSSAQGSGYSAPLYLPVRSGRGLVLVRKSDGLLYLVLEHSDESRMLEKSPQKKFTSRFIKEYRKHNQVPPPDRPARELVNSSNEGPASPAPNESDRSKVQTLVFAGEYTVSNSPGSNFQGRMELRLYGDAVAGTLYTNSGRQAEVAGIRTGKQLSLNLRFSKACPGTAKVEATLDGTALVGSYSASDCNGEYGGTLALLGDNP